MGVEIRYKVKGGQEKAATIKRKVHITSVSSSSCIKALIAKHNIDHGKYQCCALCDDYRLPSYQRKDPGLHNDLACHKQSHTQAYDCQCAFTFAEMVAQEEEEATFVNALADMGTGPAWSLEADPLTKTPAMSA